MIPHTKEVLELGTDILVDVGLKRKSRGKALWQINEEMSGCIQISARVFNDGSLHLYVYGFVYWEVFEKLMSITEGRKHRFAEFPTVTRYLTPLPLMFFPPNELPQEEFQRLRRQVTEVAIPAVEKMADIEYFITETKFKVDANWSPLERYIGLIWLAHGYEAAKKAMPEICKIAEQMDAQRLDDVESWFAGAKAAFEQATRS